MARRTRAGVQLQPRPRSISSRASAAMALASAATAKSQPAAGLTVYSVSPSTFTVSANQLKDNLAAVELTLTQDELRQLDEVSALAPEYPGWVLPLQGADRLEPVDRWERFREASKPH